MKSSEKQSEDLTPSVNESDHMRGRNSAPFTLVQFGDYECPFSAAAHWQIDQLLKDFPAQARFVFRHFPLEKKHRFAMRAAEAVEAAAAQGKFWEMHNALLRHQYVLGWEGLRDAALALGLDVPRFEQEILDHVYRPKIHKHQDSGMRSGVDSTPTYFVNGVFYDGPDNYDEFAAMIRRITGAQS